MDREERPRVARTAPAEKSAPEHSANTPIPAERGGDGEKHSVQDQIGLQLRSLYDDVLNEATPERFLKLLQDLDEKTRSK
ncbi:NepR domain-containing protein [Hyphomicrobiales bacterium]|nr:NepR domain-containing protein [Hyphomicrobiales bacterium]